MPQVQPNFLIVGAAKAGTTSLYAWLQQHPDAYLPRNKEPRFFVHHGIRVTDPARYYALFAAGAGKAAIGEASTAYLSAPEAPGLIRQHLGKIKIIILLRNPVDRALSLYQEMVKCGLEWITPFERALAAEQARLDNDWFWSGGPGYVRDFAYFGSGCYYAQVKRYLDTFGDAVKIVLLEDIRRSPADVFAEVCEFIGISPAFTPEMEPHNRAEMPRFPRLQFLLTQVEQLAFVHSLKPARVRRWTTRIQRWNNRMGSAGKMLPATRTRLMQAYREDVLRTADLIGRDLSHWVLPAVAAIPPDPAATGDKNGSMSGSVAGPAG